MDPPAWAEGFQRSGLYFEGYTDNLESVLEKHHSATVTTYGTRRSKKGCHVVNDTEDKENQSVGQEQSEQGTSTPKLYWRKCEGGREVNFDNTPFSLDKKVTLDCQYGVQYWKDKERKGKRLHLQTSRKLGCYAHIQIRHYTIYPEYRVNTAMANSMSKNQLRQLKEEQLKCLRQEILESRAKAEKRYFVSIPTEEAHNGHPTGAAAGFSQRVHPLITQKISELVSAGIISTQEVRKVLKHFVQHDLPKDHGITPSTTDRAFYPMPGDIRNHICKAKRALELSKLDQENLRLKVNEWNKSPSSHHYFRPYIQADTEDASMATHLQPKVGCFAGATGGDDEWLELQGTSEGCSQTFLWVHQEDWQQDLLVKFGNTITLIDATYKTTKYDIPLFFLCVKTNVKYVVVAEFVTQSESAKEISEALSIIKTWNPEWCPLYFMSDYSEAEQLAIAKVFPTTTLYLCDFHREQAWERWVKDHKHGLAKEEAEELLELLRDCAHAPAPRSEEQLPVDHYYQVALTRLKNSTIWNHNQQVQQWLTTKWLGIPERWARAFRATCFHASVETNNGVETQNKLLKYSYLPRKKTFTLSQLVTLLVEDFLPDSRQRYLFQNYQMSSTYRTYSDKIPVYLQGRPRRFILHCLSREQKAKTAFSGEDILESDNKKGLFVVRGESNCNYRVDFGIESGQPSCSCGDWAKTHFPCKHFFLIFQSNPQWGWGSLPESYFQNPYLCADKDALGKFSSELYMSGEPDTSDDTPSPSLNENEQQMCDDSVLRSEMNPKKHQEVKHLQQKLRISLKLIEGMSYNITNEQKLREILKRCQHLEQEVQRAIPSESGLLLRPQPTYSLLARKIKLKYWRSRMSRAQRYSSLVKKGHSGRPKQDPKIRNRVGWKASQLRKISGQTCKLHHSQKSHAMSSPSHTPTSTDKIPKVTAGNKRARRCGGCAGCASTDCGVCTYCKDMKKFGGPGRKKKCCINRRCLQQTRDDKTGPGGSSSITTKELQLPRAESIDSALTRFLFQRRRKVVEAIGDGNCFFRAISYFLFGDQDHYSEVRELLVRFENINGELFQKQLPQPSEINPTPRTISAHIKNIMVPFVWATELEAMATATYFQLPLYYCADPPPPNRVDYCWEVFKPLCQPESLRYPVLTEDAEALFEGVKPLTHFELAYYRDHHYNCIVSSDTGNLPDDLPQLSHQDEHFDQIIE